MANLPPQRSDFTTDAEYQEAYDVWSYEVTQDINSGVLGGGANVTTDEEGKTVIGGVTFGYQLRYLDTAYGSSNIGDDFAQTIAGLPTNRTETWQGLREIDTLGPSTNPADFIWRQLNVDPADNPIASYLLIGNRNIDWDFTDGSLPNYTEDTGPLIDLENIAAGIIGLPGTPGIDGMNGMDGTSPTVEAIDGGATITDAAGTVVTILDGDSPTVVAIDGGIEITDADGDTVTIEDGTNGVDGDGLEVIYRTHTSLPATPDPSTGAPADWSFALPGTVPSGSRLYLSVGTRTNNTGNYTWSPAVVFSANTVSVTATADGVSVSDGVSSVEITNGSDGEGGAAGISPTVTATADGVLITAADGTAVEVVDGANGMDGDGLEVIYINAEDTPDTPDPSLEAPVGWSFTVPTVTEGNRLYISIGSRENNAGLYTWSPAVVFSANSVVVTSTADGASITDGTSTVEITNGTNGMDGNSPTVIKDGGTVTITDSEGDTVTIVDGTNGMDGDGLEVIYRPFGTVPATPAPSANVPTGWSFTVPPVPLGERLYISIGTRVNNVGNYTWSPAVVISATTVTVTETDGGAVLSDGTTSITITDGADGSKGDPGSTGATGHNAFFAYADNVTESAVTNFQETAVATSRFIGTFTGAARPANTLQYSWSEYVGSNGEAGLNGYSSAIVEVYKRQTAEPTDAPNTVGTYTIATATLVFGVSDTVSNGWTTTVPDGDLQLWERRAAAVTNGATDTIEANEWSSVIQAGSVGVDGMDGINAGPVFLYRRTTSSSTPTSPSATSSYNFSTGVLSPATNNGWTTTLPDEAGGRYLWATHATATDRATTTTIAASAWSTPQLLSTDGFTPIVEAFGGGVRITDAFGDSVDVLDGNDGEDGDGLEVIYRTAASTPSTPSASSGAPGGWSFTVPSVPAGQRLYISIGTRENNTGNYTWSPAVVFSANSVTVTNTSNGASISDGVNTVAINDGTNGTDGTDGTDGADGSNATVSKSGDVVTVTDGAGNSVTVTDGDDGMDGDGLEVIYRNATFLPATPSASSSAPMNWSFTYTAATGNNRTYASIGKRTNNVGNYTWSPAIPFDAKDGADGEDGEDGDDGRPGIGFAVVDRPGAAPSTSTVPPSDAEFATAIGVPGATPRNKDVIIVQYSNGRVAFRHNGSVWNEITGGFIDGNIIAADYIYGGAINFNQAIGGSVEARFVDVNERLNIDDNGAGISIDAASNNDMSQIFLGLDANGVPDFTAVVEDNSGNLQGQLLDNDGFRLIEPTFLRAVSPGTVVSNNYTSTQSITLHAGSAYIIRFTGGGGGGGGGGDDNYAYGMFGQGAGRTNTLSYANNSTTGTNQSATSAGGTVISISGTASNNGTFTAAGGTGGRGGAAGRYAHSEAMAGTDGGSSFFGEGGSGSSNGGSGQGDADDAINRGSGGGGGSGSYNTSYGGSNPGWGGGGEGGFAGQEQEITIDLTETNSNATLTITQIGLGGAGAPRDGGSRQAGAGGDGANGGVNVSRVLSGYTAHSLAEALGQADTTIGYNQTWATSTTGAPQNTWTENNTGRPIQVQLSQGVAGGGTSFFQVATSAAGANSVTISEKKDDNVRELMAAAIIPPGFFWRQTNHGSYNVSILS